MGCLREGVWLKQMVGPEGLFTWSLTIVEVEGALAGVGVPIGLGTVVVSGPQAPGLA